MTVLADAKAIARRELIPIERLSGSAWADKHGWIARGSGTAEGGPYRVSRTPYMADILDVLCDEVHQEVVFNKPAQIGFTEAINQAVGYVMHHDPSGMIVVQPDIERAKAWMKERVDAMLAESPALRGILRSEGGRRTSDDTMQRKVFRNGWLVCVGANSPAGLRSRPARRGYADEISGWTLDAKGQGDPWGLLGERTNSFWNKKLVMGSTPGEVGVCPVTKAIAASDRRRYHVHCPACGYSAPFEWKDPRTGDRLLVCDRDPAGELIPETAAYACRGCGVLIPEHEKLRMLTKSRGADWVATQPGRRVVGFDMGTGGGLMSPWLTWADLIRKYIKALRAGGGKEHGEEWKVFCTHSLGDPYVPADDMESITVHTLRAREVPMEEAPEAVRYAVAAVDVQKDRVETLEVGVGEGSVLAAWRWTAHTGDPQTDDVWNDVAEHLESTTAWGVPLLGVGFDTGYLPATVWAQIDRLARRPALRGARLLGTKGVGGPGRPLVVEPGRATKRTSRPPWAIGTDTAKDALLVHGVHLPVWAPGSVQFAEGLPEAFYDQLTSEGRVLIRWGGRYAYAWQKRQRTLANEALDLLVISLAVVTALQVRYRVNPLTVPRTVKPSEKPTKPVSSAASATVATQRGTWIGRSGGGWMR